MRDRWECIKFGAAMIALVTAAVIVGVFSRCPDYPLTTD